MSQIASIYDNIIFLMAIQHSDWKYTDESDS